MKTLTIILCLLIGFVANAQDGVFTKEYMLIQKFNASYSKDKQSQHWSTIGTVLNSAVDTSAWYDMPPLGAAIDTASFTVGVVSTADSIGLNWRIEYGYGADYGPDTASLTGDKRIWLGGGAFNVLWQSLDDTTKSYGSSKQIPAWLRPVGPTSFRMIVTFLAAKNSVDNDNTGKLTADNYRMFYTYFKRK